MERELKSGNICDGKGNGDDDSIDNGNHNG